MKGHGAVADYGYVTFRDNSFMIPIGLILTNGHSLSLFTPAGTYVGDFLDEEIREVGA